MTLLSKAMKVADQAETYEYSGSTLLARGTLDRIETCKRVEASGMGLRIVKGGRIGFSFLSNPLEADRAVATALKIARLSEDEGYSLPTPKKVKAAKVHDKKYLAWDEGAMIDSILEMMGSVEKAGASPSQAEVSMTESSVHITSSEGMDRREKATLGVVYMVAKSKEAVGSEFFTSRKAEHDFDTLGARAAELAIKGAGSRPITHKGNIILGVDVLADFISHAIVPAISGENARRKRSAWHDKIGRKVTSASLSIHGDSLMPYGVGTHSFDDEGVPCRRMEIISEGKLRNFIYDTKSANLAGTESTGNGFRASFSSQPGIGITNIVLEPGEREDVYATKDAIYLHEVIGVHNINHMTGDFALDVGTGFHIEKGELGKGIRGCMLVGNVFDMFRKPVAFHNQDQTRGWLTAPEMLIRGKVVHK